MSKDVEQEDLVIQGEKPVQTKHQAPQYVLQREVRPQVKMNMQKIRTPPPRL